jgi:hypothetical protein
MRVKLDKGESKKIIEGRQNYVKGMRRRKWSPVWVINILMYMEFSCIFKIINNKYERHIKQLYIRVNKQVSYFTSPISIMSKLHNCHICNFFLAKDPLEHYYLIKKEREKQRKHEIEKIKPSGARPHRNLPSASSPPLSATSIGRPKP